jgi:hypothetical protein
VLELLADPKALIPLRGRTRADSVAIRRAARALERQGKCVVIHLWDEDVAGRQKGICAFAVHPDLTVGGRPAREVSVARVPSGTEATLRWKGSLRDIAREEGISKTQVVRDLELARARESPR